MDHAKLRLKSLIHTIMGQMSQIENETGSMFHELDAGLESDIFEAIDAKDVAKLNMMISRLDRMMGVSL